MCFSNTVDQIQIAIKHRAREREILNRERKNKPSLRMAIISTMKGGKSNFHMRASNMKPSCQHNKNQKSEKILYCIIQEI